MDEIDTGIDWSSLISEDLPAGPDMQDTAEFAELEAAAAVIPEQQYGDVVIPAKEPEWRHVFELAAGLSKQTHDLRVLLLLTRALSRLHGLPGLLRGLQALDATIGQQWDHVHPQIVVDDMDDPQIRYGALSGFADPEGLVGDMREAIALRSPLGAFTVRDLERVVELDSVEINGIAINRQRIDDMVSDMRQTSEAPALDLPIQLVDLLNGVLLNIERHSGAEFTPDLTSLKRPLERISGLLGSKAQAQEDTVSLLAEGTMAAGDGRIAGPVNSRADVTRAMDAICVYLERHEPTNPVPLLIRRAQRLMTMSFLDIVKDMAPDGLNQALNIAGADAEQPA
jgi:type VI secretion system protein ImpA